MTTKFEKGDIVELLPFNADWWHESPFWHVNMNWFIGKQHVVYEVDCDGDIILKNTSGDTYYFSPEWLKLSKKFDTTKAKKFWMVLHEGDVSEKFYSQKKAEAHARELSKKYGSTSCVLQAVSMYEVENKTTKIKFI